ncbi:hypothetical protein OG225_14670 [Nocardia sp. NBC_01377]|uniref:hypothetical protein n=1 Tax=Nocardia sp. NBC_01377 TaxID=2903595 RepID=UPI00324744A8
MVIWNGGSHGGEGGRAADGSSDLRPVGSPSTDVDGGTAAAGGWYHHPEAGRYVLGPST